MDIAAGDELPLGSRIRLRRQAQSIRLSTMARDLGYDKGYLSHVENNRAIPSEDLLKKIAEYLGLTLQDLRQCAIVKLTRGTGSLHPGSVTDLGLTLPALSLRMTPRKRTIAQRIERLLSSAHLTDAENELVEESLVALTGEMLRLIKDARSLK